ncbi:hypothetical protein TURU_049263 [Turdus rufiventris]|nr:hypothetical protein TURU_049263 [Turdus rufiventris]
MRSHYALEEGAAETICDELTASRIPCPPVPLGEENENMEGKGSLESRNSFHLTWMSLREDANLTGPNSAW